MAPLRIHLLGGFSITTGESQIPVLTRPRQQSLLAYLLIRCRQPQQRRMIAATFWPESSEAQANKNLRVLLVEIRQAWPQLEQYVQIERHTLHWLASSSITVDVFEFEQAIQAADLFRQHQQPEQQLTALRTAVDLYTGDLLPHLYDEWIEKERRQLAYYYTTALGQLASLYYEHHYFADAIQSAQRLQQYDPLSDLACRLLLDCYPQQGETSRALQAYQTYESIRLRELEVEPDADLKERYLKLLRHQRHPKTNQPAYPAPKTEAVPTLVGRMHEWQQLTTLWRNAHPHNAQLVLLTGEAGIGKTVLAEHFLRWAQSQGASVADAKCYAFGSSNGEEALSYAPLVTWLRAETFANRLLRLDDLWQCQLLRILPELHSQRPDLAQPEAMRDGLQRRQFFEALAHAICAGAHPVLLFIDDLQWCDRETLDWLLYLLLQFPLPMPLLIIGALRNGEIANEHPYHPWRAQLRYHQRWQEFTLGRLNVVQSAQIAQEIITQAQIGDTLPPHFDEVLHQHTDGNPLFIVETMRALLNSSLPSQSDRWTDYLRGAIASGALPPKIQATIEQRLTTLSPQAQQIVELGAVIGRVFTSAILTELNRNEEELVRSLEELLHRQILREESVDSYDFTHDRVREVVYTRLSQTRRRLLHKQIAFAIERVNASNLDVVSGHLALHYERAGLYADAIDFYEKASKVAQRLYANEEMAGYLRRALTLLRQQPVSPQRNQKELALLLPLGVSLTIGRRYDDPEINTVFEEIYTLSRQIENVEQRFDALRSLCEHHRNFLRMRDSLEIANFLLNLAKEINRTDFLMQAYTEKGLTLAHLCRSSEAIYFFEQAISHYHAQEHSTLITRHAFHPLVVALCFLATTKQLLGYSEQATVLINQAMTIANEIAHPASIFYAHVHVGMVHLYRTEYQFSCDLFTELIIMAEKLSGHPYVLGEITCAAVKILYSDDKHVLDESTTRIHQYLFRNQSLTLETGSVLFLLILSMGRLRAGQIGDAQRMLALATDTFKITGPAQGGDVMRYYLEGKLCYLCGELIQAEEWLRAGIAVLQSYQHKIYELRLAIELAKLWIATDRRVEARQVVADVYSWFSEGLDTPVLQDARYLLAYLNGEAEFIEDLKPFVHW